MTLCFYQWLGERWIQSQYKTIWLYQWLSARGIGSENMTFFGCTSGWVQDGYLVNTLPCSVWQNRGFEL